MNNKKLDTIKTVIEGFEDKQKLLDFMCWLNKEDKLGYTQVGLERIVDNYNKQQNKKRSTIYK